MPWELRLECASCGRIFVIERERTAAEEEDLVQETCPECSHPWAKMLSKA